MWHTRSVGVFRNRILEETSDFAPHGEESSDSACFGCLMYVVVNALLLLGLCYVAAWLQSLANPQPTYTRSVEETRRETEEIRKRIEAIDAAIQREFERSHEEMMDRQREEWREHDANGD